MQLELRHTRVDEGNLRVHPDRQRRVIKRFRRDGMGGQAIYRLCFRAAARLEIEERPSDGTIAPPVEDFSLERRPRTVLCSQRQRPRVVEASFRERQSERHRLVVPDGAVCGTCKAPKLDLSVRARHVFDATAVLISVTCSAVRRDGVS